MKPLYALLASLCVAVSLSAKVKHVYVDAVKGSDSNSGTMAKPFKTLTKGMTTFNRDVVVHVLPGTYGPQSTGDFWDATAKKTKNVQLNNYQNVRVVGTDRAKCIVDFNNLGGQWGFIQIRGQGGNGVEFSHLTFKNCDDTGTVWAAGPFAVDWSVKNVNIHSCEFIDTLSTIVIWGGFDVAFHDNLIRHTKTPSKWTPVGVRVRVNGSTGKGDRVAIYNNVIYANKVGHGISWGNHTANPTKWICNNIVVGCDKAYPDAKLDSKTIVESNIAFSSTTNFAYAKLPTSNKVVDPQFVAPATQDFHLKSSSPGIESGYAMGLLFMGNDYAGNARAVDNDENLSAIPDRGIYEDASIAMTQSGWGIGQTANFTLMRLKTTPYAGIFLLAYGRIHVLANPFGSLGVDPGKLLLALPNAFPGKVVLPVPNDSSLAGLRTYAQGIGLRNSQGKTYFQLTGTLDLDL